MTCGWFVSSTAENFASVSSLRRIVSVLVLLLTFFAM
jgi:hypothetical protein